MQKHYFFLLFLLTFNMFYGQTPCDDANSYLLNAYAHVKDAYDANNISHLKYFANRSFESFKLSKKTLSSCDCETALNLANESIDLIAKVENTETFEDGRFYVKRARDTSKESIIAVDKCSITTSYNITSENEELSSLQNEQLKLKEQQAALKLKEVEIKTKLLEQKALELKLQKESMITTFQIVISRNIETYNNTLKDCDCKYETIEQESKSTGISEKNIKEIKLYYLESLQGLTTNYLAQLRDCEESKI